MSKKNSSSDESFLQVVKRILHESKMQVSFLIGIVAVFAGIIPYTQKVFEFNRVSWENRSYNFFPIVTIFPMSIAYMFFFLVIRMVWLKIVPVIVEPLIKV